MKRIIAALFALTLLNMTASVSSLAEEPSHILIAYFTMPEDVDDN